MVLAAATIGFATLAASPAYSLTFQLSPPGSSVLLSNQSCLTFSSCSISAAIASGMPTGAFNLNVGDSNTFDFIRWTPHGSGLNDTFDVTATLAFLQPVGANTTGNGSGGAIAIGLGAIVGGHLNWTDVPTNVLLADGSVINIDFQDGISLLSGAITTTATVTLVSETPLPAALPLFVGGLGALGVLGWHRKRKLAA
jgi:hypothetical protein